MQRALCEAVAAVARRDLPAGRWPELLPELKRAASSGEPRERTAALSAFAALAAAAPAAIGRDFADMQPALLAGLADGDSTVRARMPGHCRCVYWSARLRSVRLPCS